MNGRTIFKEDNKIILQFPELYDPVHLPTSIVVEGKHLTIDFISDEICIEKAMNGAAGYHICRTIYFK